MFLLCRACLKDGPARGSTQTPLEEDMTRQSGWNMALSIPATASVNEPRSSHGCPRKCSVVRQSNLYSFETLSESHKENNNPKLLPCSMTAPNLFRTCGNCLSVRRIAQANRNAVCLSSRQFSSVQHRANGALFVPIARNTTACEFRMPQHDSPSRSDKVTR